MHVLRLADCNFGTKCGGFCVIQAGLLTYEAGAFPWLGTVIVGISLGWELFWRVDVPPGPGSRG